MSSRPKAPPLTLVDVLHDPAAVASLDAWRSAALMRNRTVAVELRDDRVDVTLTERCRAPQGEVVVGRGLGSGPTLGAAARQALYSFAIARGS